MGDRTAQIGIICIGLENTATVYYETDGSVRICGQAATYYLEPEDS